MWIAFTWDIGERVLESCSALGALEYGPLWTLFSSLLDMLDQRMALSIYSRLIWNTSKKVLRSGAALGPWNVGPCGAYSRHYWIC